MIIDFKKIKIFKIEENNASEFRLEIFYLIKKKFDQKNTKIKLIFQVIDIQFNNRLVLMN